MANDIIAAGMTAKQLVELLCTDKARNAAKALAYFDGDQEVQMIKLLSDPHKGRKSWQERGIIPRFRNVTKAIVEKSGRLFKDVPPDLVVYGPDGMTEDKAQTDKIDQLMNKTEWVEVFSNLDQVVRLLKTALLLVQYDAEQDRLVFEILHRGNAQVILKPNSRTVQTMIYRTSDEGDVATYRVITESQYIDLIEDKEKVTVASVVDNPYGMVPVVEFYDTNIPRNGYWVEGGFDLIAMNEMVNLHYTDAEYAISWAKLPTLFTNCRFQGEGDVTWETVEVVGRALPTQMPTASNVIGGPSRAIQLDSGGVESPFVKYESPKVDISPMDQVIEGWVKSYAADWSVNVHIAGEGRAQSGFQLVVEEIDNLELRKTRQRMFENGFRRFFQTIKKVLPGQFTDDSILFAEFQNPILPVNSLENEQSWSIRIAEKRATPIDYFIETKGLSEKEAEEKWEEIVEFNKENSGELDTTQPQAENVPTVSASEDANVLQEDTQNGTEA